jgi:hypothetical protein
MDGQAKFAPGPAQRVRAQRGRMTGSGRTRLPGNDDGAVCSWLTPRGNASRCR